MAAHDHKTTQLPRLLALAGAALLLATVSGLAGMAREAVDIGPRVGDLVAFDPNRHAFFDNVVVLTVARAGQATCDLDTAVLQRSGGSFLVEQRASGSGNHYRTHWAGPRTSAGANDCGTDADLALTRLELNSLAVAAGGFGFDHGAIWNIR